MQRFTLQSRADKASEPVSGQKPASILLVEDNATDAGLVREALEEHGVEGELTILLDGEQAIHFIQSIDLQAVSCPDLIIVDLNLPKRPGSDVLACVRRSVKCRQSPVVILTSSDARQDRDEAMRLGASRYIRKPLRLAEFIGLGEIFKAMIADAAE